MVGGSIRVLLLDFDGSFTLLIPGVEPLKAFRTNQVNVEVEKKDINQGQQQLTFMKFTFPSPSMVIKAPVLLDKQMGYQVLKQNSACVFLGRILDNITKPSVASTQRSSLSQLLEKQQQEEQLHQGGIPQLPQGTVILAPQDQGYSAVAGSVVQPQTVVQPQNLIQPQTFVQVQAQQTVIQPQETSLQQPQTSDLQVSCG